MAARPPPTRPHISLNPSSSHFSHSITEWGEDDAWDSASDSESVSNSQSVWGRSHNQTANSRPSGATPTPATTLSSLSSSSAPKPVPVPRKSQNSSSSTLALSYTYINAPSPSHADSISTGATTATTTTTTTTKNGWTIVQKGIEDGDGDGLGLDDKAATATALSESSHDDREGGGDADNDMTFEDLGAEFIDMPVIPRTRLGAGCVRQDAAEIANGAWARFPDGFLRAVLYSCIRFFFWF
jgi:hypothetical protein